MSSIAVIGIVAVVVLALLLLIALREISRRLGRLPYRKRDALLTAAELSFYGVLKQAVEQDVDIFAKVRLIDLLAIPAGTPDRQKHLNRVIAKHVDFVLCDRRTSSARLVIELDDSSHAQRRDRDAFVDEVLATAGLPLLRVPAKRGYSARELSEAIDSARR